MYFVDHCHQHGIGVILDWVPAHFPRDDHGLRRFDGTALYEHDDPRQGEHPDWGTLIFNYGRNEVRNFLLSNALFWLDKYHIDGLRVDAVASMLYLDYSREDGRLDSQRIWRSRESAKPFRCSRNSTKSSTQRHPGVLTIAEESTAWGGVSRPTYAGGLGFSLKWNMGWMNDTLRYIAEGSDSSQVPPQRADVQHDLRVHRELHACRCRTTKWCTAKVRCWIKCRVTCGRSSPICACCTATCGRIPGKKTAVHGQRYRASGTSGITTTSLQWHLLQWESHQGMQRLVADLNRIYRQEPSLYEVDFESGGFEWIDCMSSEDSVLVFMRKAKNPADYLIVCCNFTPVLRENYRVGVPREGWYQEILNTDSAHYGGTNVGSHPGRQSEPIVAQSRPHSISVNMPPLGVAIFKPS